ncbi:MAG TPA: HAMP domain-containing sensor histidine kinase [Ferruginibacter sp.]|nr:HAMP domain-containing sensor histidine kinase [Ferruginibacter sp.]
MTTKPKKIQTIYIIYWVMLAYIVAALIWWFIALDQQNREMTNYMFLSLDSGDPQYIRELERIQDFRSRKQAQYLGEGLTFFLLIIGAAIFVFRAMRNQLKLSQERQSFMMAVTHELKTPIAVSKLNLETLLKRRLEEPVQQKFLHNTLDEMNRLNALCSNLLMSSQLDSGGFSFTPEKLDLSQLLQGCIRDASIRFPSRRIHDTVTPGIRVTGDRFQLQVALNNLIENAVKYSKDDIMVTLQQDSDTCTIQLKDSGPGIPDIDKQKIFEKFYRVGNEATKSAKGTGLGLYLVARIVKKHGGTLFVTDNQPTGSIFNIQLPLSR